MLLLTTLLATLAHGQQPGNSNRAQVLQRAQKLEALGRKMFFDPSLSASEKIACATCHDPAFAYGPPNALPVQPGGKSGREWGMRAVPSLRYLQTAPQFTEHGFEEETNGDDSVDTGPTGGLTWDGRADRGRQQARIPLLSPYEMANESEEKVVTAVLHAPYAADLRKLTVETGANIVFEIILEAFEAWEQNYTEFYPYNSKYDAWLAGKAELTTPELRGLRLFEDPSKGNCARCHIASRSANGSPPQFTDYGLIALGVPRNPAIPANADRDWYDLGMCGPQRTDLSGQDQYCGRFMTPSLRNAATRRAFFHNGAIHTLKEAIAFYVNRDTSPNKFDDLPLKYKANIEMNAPFGQTSGRSPILTEQDIDDIVAFVTTLNDGWEPGQSNARARQ